MNQLLEEKKKLSTEIEELGKQKPVEKHVHVDNCNDGAEA